MAITEIVEFSATQELQRTLEGGHAGPRARETERLGLRLAAPQMFGFGHGG
jgi:hypothetical protein